MLLQFFFYHLFQSCSGQNIVSLIEINSRMLQYFTVPPHSRWNSHGMVLFHTFPHGFHTIPSGFQMDSMQFHTFPCGFHAIPSGFHTFPCEFHAFSSGFHMDSIHFYVDFHAIPSGFHMDSIHFHMAVLYCAPLVPGGTSRNQADPSRTE